MDDGYPEVTYLRRDCSAEHDVLLGRQNSADSLRLFGATSWARPPSVTPSWHTYSSAVESSSSSAAAPAPAGVSLWHRALRLLCCYDDSSA